ncbi:MAG: GrpB family protein [Actinomycetota bacterium]
MSDKGSIDSDRIAPSAKADRVVLVPYDPAWPERFAEIERELRQLLGTTLSRIEHIGSTAVPGLPAKPIIDVLAEVPDQEVARTVAVPALLAAGYYECYWQFDLPPGHFTCVKRDTHTYHRLVHLHLAPAGHPQWRSLAFRDYLRSHPGEARRYQDLKKDLAVRFAEDREGYTVAKTDYIRETTERALGLALARGSGATAQFLLGDPELEMLPVAIETRVDDGADSPNGGGREET